VHWFISDTVYLTGIDIYNHYGVLDQERSFTGLSMNGGWVVYLAPTIVVLQLVLVLLGCRKLKRGMPLARTNSLALSAACHHAPDDTDAALLPIMYGVINPSHDDGVEYVGFSSKPVQNLEAEVAYSSYGNMHQENQWWRAGRSSGMSPVDDTGEEAFELLRRT